MSCVRLQVCRSNWETVQGTVKAEGIMNIQKPFYEVLEREVSDWEIKHLVTPKGMHQKFCFRLLLSYKKIHAIPNELHRVHPHLFDSFPLSSSPLATTHNFPPSYCFSSPFLIYISNELVPLIAVVAPVLATFSSKCFVCTQADFLVVAYSSLRPLWSYVAHFP